MGFDLEPFHLLPLTNRVLPETVLQVHRTAPLTACDFYIEGVEQAQEVIGGYQHGRILNVDHHAPAERMRKRVSSATLAIQRAEAGLLTNDIGSIVVLNHNDCDSVLSGGIMSGAIEPDPIFGQAAIAADHTGAEDPIADLLQAIDAQQSRAGERDLSFSFDSLRRLLSQRPLNPIAGAALDERRRKRARAQTLVSRGAFASEREVTYAVLDEPIDGEFFPALLPDAVVILTLNPLPADQSRWQVKVRLGLAAPPELALSDLAIHEFDPGYGGRWNAGSNRRGGGTATAPRDYVSALSRCVSSALRVGGASEPPKI